jgi:transcription antitermination factor NusG
MKNDKPFAAFMEGVIVCTEQGYDEAVLEELLKKEHKTDYKNNYVDMITKIVEELLIEGKVNKL